MGLAVFVGVPETEEKGWICYVCETKWFSDERYIVKTIEGGRGKFVSVRHDVISFPLKRDDRTCVSILSLSDSTKVEIESRVTYRFDAKKVSEFALIPNLRDPFDYFVTDALDGVFQSAVGKYKCTEILPNKETIRQEVLTELRKKLSNNVEILDVVNVKYTF